MKRDVHTVGPRVMSRRGGASRVSGSLETRGRCVVKYTSPPAQEGTKYARSKVETVETSFAKSTLEVELAGDRALPEAP